MAESGAQQEPTMEEILASIRKIISEDTVEEDEKPEPAAKAAPVEAPKPVAAAAPEPEDDVLELTEVLDEAPAEEPALGSFHSESIEDISLEPVPEDDGILSPGAAALASEAFTDLSNTIMANYAGGGKTLEDLIREMLRPMLKAWLDENLPTVVERLVAREIARLARNKRF
jgi:cell pole-organizing protein PopZ